MADELTTLDGAEPNKPQPDKSAPDTPRKSDPEQSGDDKKSEVFSREYVEELRKENANRRKEASALEKRLKEIEDSNKAADDKKLADDLKWQDLAEKRQKDLEKMQAEVEAERKVNLRNRVGHEFKLPQKLVDRLQGANEEELRADAQALVTELGLDKQAEAAQTQAGSRTLTTIAPDGRPVGETDDQRRARLYQRGAQWSPLFKPQDE
jgi:hypothetical protein